MKNKSVVPVSYLLEAIKLQKEEEKKKKGGEWQKPECYKIDDNMEGKRKQIRKSSQEKNTVMSILFWEIDKINNWKQGSIKTKKTADGKIKGKWTYREKYIGPTWVIKKGKVWIIIQPPPQRPSIGSKNKRKENG